MPPGVDPPAPSGSRFTTILRADPTPDSPGPDAVSLWDAHYYLALNSTPPTGWVSADRDSYRAAYMFLEHPTDGFVARITFVGGYSDDPDIAVDAVVMDQGGTDWTLFLYDGTPWDPETQGHEANDAPVFSLPPHPQPRPDERPVIRIVHTASNEILEVRNYETTVTGSPEVDFNQIEHITTPFPDIGRRPDSVSHTVYDRVRIQSYLDGKIAIGVYYDIIHPDYHQTSTIDEDFSPPEESPPEESPPESPESPPESPEESPPPEESPSPEEPEESPDEPEPESPEEPPIDSPIIDDPDVDSPDQPDFASPEFTGEFCPPTFMSYPQTDLKWTVQHADRFGEGGGILERWTRVSGGPLRVIDGVSSLSLSFGDDPYLLQLLQPWSSEIQLHYGGELVWAGPVTSVAYSYAEGTEAPITVQASDLLHWLSRRVIQGKVEAGEVASQFDEIIRRAMLGDDIGLRANPQFSTVRGDELLAEPNDALSEIQSMARELDFTMVGRELVMGKEEVPFAHTPNLILPDHAKSFTITNLGDETASQILVRGGDDNIRKEHVAQNYPTGPNRSDPNIGIVSRLIHDSRHKNDKQAARVAYSIWKYAQPPLYSISVVLDMLKSPFHMSDLIAGARMDVYYPPLSIQRDRFRIRSVGLDINEEEDTVTLELIPLGLVNNELGGLVL